jgi:tRNA pseudouridine55 synthase
MIKRRRKRRIVDGIVLLDKPQGLTSNAAMQRVKRVYDAEKAGHTGSLDPLATGLLPICFGHATKLSGFLLEGDKCYRATMKLGARTTTGDSEGEIIATSETASIDPAAVEAARAGLVGSILQIPPMYSAIKIEGEKLYRLARQGLEINRPPRAVTIHALALIDIRGDEIDFEVRCSKGTYVRTLAEDWAAGFGQCAHLTALRRTGAEPFTDPWMIGLEALEGALHQPEILESFLLPTAAAVSGWPKCTVDDVHLQRMRHGHPVPATPVLSGECAVFGCAGELLCLGIADGTGQVQPRRWVGNDPP